VIRRESCRRMVTEEREVGARGLFSEPIVAEPV
jgi:hypothetical protein